MTFLTIDTAIFGELATGTASQFRFVGITDFAAFPTIGTNGQVGGTEGSLQTSGTTSRSMLYELSFEIDKGTSE